MTSVSKKPDHEAEAENQGEPSEGTIPADPALEAALREAADAVEARQSKRDVEAEEPVPEERVPPGEKVSDVQAELQELKEKYVRLAADFDNFRKRSLKDREEAHQFGHQNLVKELLPSVDNLERAIAHARASEEAGGLLEGVELVYRELEAALAKHGVVAIDPKGQPFDPALHEAMSQMPDASVPPNTVLEVFQKGYQLRARLLRPARVVVSKLPDAEPDT